MARGFRIVPLTVFIYDCSRFLFLLTLLNRFVPGTGQPQIEAPYLLFTAPHALFPLMSFFVLVRPGLSRPYIPLYLSGKVLSILCMVMWFSHVVRILSAEPFMGSLHHALWAVLFAAADLVTMMGMITAKGAKRPGAVPEVSMEHVPAENVPAEGGQ